MLRSAVNGQVSSGRWAFGPVVPLVVLIASRTVAEDRFLLNELLCGICQSGPVSDASGWKA